ncbi:MAG: glycosyltransferase [Bacteroidales bacterium]|nr:glycosyltransferase [Bacteroidales bacterium]
MARISVLMGVYNCEKYLQQALGSLYAQTYRDFKIIICDDGSSDATYDVAAREAAAHSNIVLIRNQKNMGLNYTLNRCLEYADTEYCARMDGDDISMPSRFKTEVAFLDEHPQYAIVSAPMKYFDDGGVFRTGKGGGEPQPKDFPKGTPFCHAPCMVRTDAYKAVGGYGVSDKLLRVEDYHLWIKMYAKGYKGYMLEEPLYMMRDDRNAAHRRSFKARVNEARVKAIAIKTFRLPVWNYIYCLKPIILGLMPSGIYSRLRQRKNG